jgi:type I restriction enzyme S subunit
MNTELKATWKAYSLDRLGFVGRGRSRHRPRNEPTLYGGPYPFFQTGDIKEADLYLYRYSQTYNEKGLAQSKLWPPGTLCITIAANIAETAILTIPGCFPDSVVGFIADDTKSDARFIKYYIDTIKLRMQSMSRGTTQDNLSLDKLLSFDFVVPDVLMQRKVAAILSAYDDLIENNLRRIAILEEMARLIYREWFVHFRFPEHERVRLVDSPLGRIPEGWSCARLGDVATINGMSIQGTDTQETILYVDIASVSPGRIDNVEQMCYEDAPGRARRLVRHGDTIWSSVRPNRRSFALILHPPPNLVVSTGFAVISPHGVPFGLLYHMVTTEPFVSYLTNHTKGAAYPAVSADDFRAADVLLPPRTLQEHFHESVDPVLLQKHNLLVRNQVLRRTRDLLLPKLISGELDFSRQDTDGEMTGLDSFHPRGSPSVQG